VLARALEGAGVATTLISLVREHTEKTRPPRALFVPFPFGHALGRADDAPLQHRVLGAALELLSAPAGPVLRDFPDDAEPGGEPPAPRQASMIVAAAPAEPDAERETAQMQRHHAEWLARHGGRTAVALTGIPAARLDGVVRFLESFAGGGEEIAGWFWGETAAGGLLRRVRERLDASGDPAWKAAAFGVAR
jgi:hypothetical protein